MRNISLLVLLLALFACSNKNVNKVTLKGHLINFNESSLLLNLGDKVDTLVLDKDGRFESTIRLEKQVSAYLVGGKIFRKVFVLIPGYELSFSQDVNKKENGFKYLNDNLLVRANFYSQANLDLGKKLKPIRREFMALNEDAFISKANEIYIKKKNLLDAFAKANNYADSDFVKREQNEIKYEKLNSFISYKSSHKYFSEDKSYLASEKINAPLKEADFNAGELVGVPNYNTFIKEVLSVKAFNYLMANPEVNGKNNTYELSQFACLDELTTNAKVKEYLAYTILADRNKLQRVLTGELILTEESELVKKFRALVKNPKYLNPINMKVAEWDKLAQGKDAPDFTGQTIKGKSVSLSDLKGKYVYVDVWATWCGPCVAEIPYLQKLEKDYHDRNIIFLSVSVDADKDKWKKKVIEDKLGGVQINVGKGSSVRKDYRIRGIPRFMLFDMEGKILSVNAPRPSEKIIREVLDNLKGL